MIAHDKDGPLGYTSIEEAGMKAMEQELMDNPDIDDIRRMMDNRTVCTLVGLIWDGKLDEAQYLVYRFGRRWAEQTAERAMG